MSLRRNYSQRLATRASMTYMTLVLTRPVTVVETRAFERMSAGIWSAEEVAELVDHLARQPESGDVIPGTGGVRKVRWGRAGSGKRSGTRVIYFYYNPECPLYLLLAYAKAQATDMTPEEKKAVAALAATIKDSAGRRKD